MRNFRIKNIGHLEIYMVGQRGVSNWFIPQELSMFPAYQLRNIVKIIEDDGFTEEEIASVGVVKRLIEEKKVM